MFKKIGFVLTITAVLTSCGVRKPVVKEEPKQIEEIPVGKSFSEILTTEVSKKEVKDSTLTFTSKMKFIKDGNEQPKVSLVLKMRNNKLIWGSASVVISIGRILITPDGAKGYAKFPDKVYFDSDYALIEKKVQLKDMSYEQLESLLTGRSVFELNLSTISQYDIENKNEQIVLTYKSNKDLVQQKSKTEVGRIIVLDKNYNVIKETIIKPDTGAQVDISYSNFTTVNKQSYPLLMQIDVKDNKHTFNITLEHKSIVANETLEVPFEIPSGYKRIQL